MIYTELKDTKHDHGLIIESSFHTAELSYRFLGDLFLNTFSGD